MKVFYGPAIRMWQNYVHKILEIGFRSNLEIGDFNTFSECDILVEELGDQMKYIYAKQWKYSFMFSTEPFHHEPRPFSMVFCGNNSMICGPIEKCVLFPFYWFQYNLNKSLEGIIPCQSQPDKFACAFVSNPLNEFRSKTVISLANSGLLDSFGMIGNNTGGKTFQGDVIQKMKEYKFCLCFENSAHELYISEKLPMVLQAGIVPVYWGCPNIGKYFNKKRFLTIEDTTENAIIDLVVRMVNLANNTEAYMKMVNEDIFPPGGSPLSLESMGEQVHDYLFPTKEASLDPTSPNLTIRVPEVNKSSPPQVVTTKSLCCWG